MHAVIHSPQQAFSQQSSGAAASRSRSHSSATNSNLLDIEEVRLDELEDAISKHHLMVRSRHHRDGLLHRLSSYIDSPRSSARPGRDAQSTRPDIPKVD